MKSLLLIKEYIKKFCSRNEVFITPVLKFVLTFTAMLTINSNIGYMTRIASFPVALIVALAGSFLPVNLTLVILALLITAHIYALSLECAILVLALFLVLFLLYFRFASKDSIAAILTPLCFVFKIPYVMPIAMGLTGNPASIVSVGSGVTIYYVLNYIHLNEKTLAGGETESMIAKIRTIVDAFISNKAMFVTIAAFAFAVILVYVIRRMSIDYSWQIAIVGGALSSMIIMIIGDLAFDTNISIGGAFVGAIIAIIINFVLQFFLFNLDYNRSEKVQFEDDEYYYYVKAIPKITIKAPEKRVTKINSQNYATKRNESQPIMNQRSTAAGNTPVRAKATTQEKTVETPVRTRTASKGPLGLSGGRPAGEGRMREQIRNQQTRDQEVTRKIIEPLTTDEIDE